MSSPDDPVLEFAHHECVVKIYQDFTSRGPRETEANLGTIYYTSSRFCFGDQRVSLEKMSEILDSEGIRLPVHASIGSTEISLSTKPFRCPFDAGLVGMIHCTPKKAEEFFGGRDNTSVQAVLARMRYEIERFSQYLSGDVYRVEVHHAKGIDTFKEVYGHENAERVARNHIDKSLRKQLALPGVL